MSEALPDYYFRIRENGAFAFRIEVENRRRRFSLTQIAAINIRNGEVKPHGDTLLTERDIAEIDRWIAMRRDQLAQRELDDILRAIDHLNLTTQWAQSRATPEQLSTVTDKLLLAMHDLRQVLIRKRAESLTGPP
ncbi:MAG: hypothetical protein ACK5M4_10045 [Pseudorhodobacter sp.]